MARVRVRFHPEINDQPSDPSFAPSLESPPFAAGNHSASRGVERDPSAKAREKRGTMQSGESIYNLIPPPEVRQARPRMHKSQHPGTVDPAEFGLGPRRATATFGRAPGDVKPETSKFLRKNTGALNASANTRASPPERFSPVDAFSWGPHTSSVPRWKTRAMFQNRPHRIRARWRFPRVRRRTRLCARNARGSRLARRAPSSSPIPLAASRAAPRPRARWLTPIRPHLPLGNSPSTRRRPPRKTN